MTVTDPFAHLHDEAYADRYLGREATADTLVVRPLNPGDRLAGPWRFTLDLFDEGLRQNWPSLDAEPAERWTVPRDFEVEAGELVSVPSCWNVNRPEWTYFEGTGWYTLDFDWTPGPEDERALLRIGAANYEARVFLNGQLLGRHRGGSTPFAIEATRALKRGSNRLQIAVDNRRRADRVPMNHFDWFNYGGLHREVALQRLPSTFIRRTAIGLVPDGTFGRIRVSVWLNEPVTGEARIAVPDLGVDARAVVEDGLATLVLDARPELWSPAAPRLYDVTVGFGEDAVSERVGFREIRVAGTEILLNGEPIFLKGVCVHEDDLRLGRVSTEEDVRRRFADARDLGANFLRLAHYPHHEHVARIADELGFLLWAEIPVYWAIDFPNPSTYADARNQLRELVRRDVNRASVILWGVGNENADTQERYRFMADLAQTARTEDPTRLVTAACLINRETFTIEDRLSAHLDVIGLNEYFGWYEPDLEGLERLLANSAGGKPVIVSETGADALAGLRSNAGALFSEDKQSSFYADQIDILRRAPFIRGIAAWLLYDFRSERRQTSFQRGFNRKGLIAEDKTTRKLAFKTLGDFYRSLRARG